MKRPDLKAYLIVSLIILSTPFIPAYCENFEPGKIAITFNFETSAEDAVKLVEGLNLQIIKRDNFDILSVHFNIEEKDVYAFMRDMQRESIVRSVAKGQKLEMEGREGAVVRVRFKKSADRQQIDDLSLSYRKREEVIAWRYYRSGPPVMIVKVPVGKERDWIRAIGVGEYANMVNSVTLVSFDFPL